MKTKMIVFKSGVRMTFDHGEKFFPPGTKGRKDLWKIIAEVNARVEDSKRILMDIKNSQGMHEEKQRNLDCVTEGTAQIMGLMILASMLDNGWDYKFEEG